MAKILIIDDEPELLELLSLMIQGELGHDILMAANGVEGIELLESHSDITAIISDWNMKGGGGSLVLEHLHKMPHIPFILMTGSYQKELNLAGLTGHLSYFRVFEKPFGLEALIGALKEGINTFLSKSKDFDEYCRIRVESLLFEESISWALYLKLSDKKFVKISREGEQTLSDVISHYRQKEINSFYMKREDFKQWVDSLFALKGQELQQYVKRSTQGNLSKLAEVSKRFHMRFHLTLSTFGVDDSHLEAVSVVLEEVVKELHERPELSELLNIILTGDNYLSDHSFFIIFLASYLAKDLGLSSLPTTKKIIHAAFFHDLAISNSELAKSESHPADVGAPSAYDELLYHPEKILKILSSCPEFSGDVSHMILEHHELPDGSGYPRGLEAGSIHPLSCLFILCHKASELFLLEGKKAEEVAQAFRGTLGESYNKGNFRRPLQVMRSHFSMKK